MSRVQTHLFPNLAHSRRKFAFIFKHRITTITPFDHMTKSLNVNGQSIRGITMGN